MAKKGGIGVAAVAEEVGLACAKTVAGDKEFFLWESSTAYLSAARLNVRSNPNQFLLDFCLIKVREIVYFLHLTVEFRIKETQKLFYTSRATVYVMPVASL
ncbi:uncharacterized protein LOC109821021 [Asparagus officinalis]|uniref:uncharacterized protein LOC109821021 n=1 Tax=Asparagus officinalis TaxID=4686 RepID=UPI00098E121A|nr:uncharacterized protein LOC109821021 [Asparagus officinalis]